MGEEKVGKGGEPWINGACNKTILETSIVVCGSSGLQGATSSGVVFVGLAASPS